MDWVTVAQYFGLGTLGGLLVDGMELVNAIRDADGEVPRRYRRWGTWIGEVFRLVIGGVLTSVMYASRQVDTPITAVTIGIAAPIIIERFTKGAATGPMLGRSDG